LHRNFFLDSFHAVKVSFGMIGLIAVYIFYRAAVIFLRRESLRLWYALALFPSILFWSSTIGKDPIVLLTIAVYCYGTVVWVREHTWFSALILLAGVWGASAIRPWMGFILAFPAFIATIPTVFRSGLVKKITLLCMLSIIAAVSANNVFVYLGMKTGRGLTSVANERFSDFSKGGSGSQALSAASRGDGEQVEEGTGRFKRKLDMLVFIPVGMFSALFRPLPGEVKNIFGFLSGIEGAFLLALFLLVLIRGRWRDLSDPLVCILRIYQL
ncbi:MAG: hypothetical protein WC547_00315, partial [Candidatus Omnitrophota bacterium]